MKTDKQKQFLVQAAYYLLIVALIYGALKLLVPIFLPFILGAVIVYALRRPAVWISKKSHIPIKAVSLLILIIFYLLFFSLIFFAGAQMISAIKAGIPKLPDFYTDRLLPAINAFSDFLEQTVAKFDPAFEAEVDSIFQQITTSLGQSISTISGTLMWMASNVALGLPNTMIKLLLTVVYGFFMMSDYERVLGFLIRHLPAKLQRNLANIRSKLTGSLWIYTRAYTLLLLITFAELLAGLLVMRIPYAPVIAAAIAIFDLMPILGVGGILIPWAATAAVLEYYPMAVGVASLYLVIAVVRNTLEPRLVGGQIGLHPLATLISLFAGGQLFGIVGLFGLPVALSVLVQLRRDKYKFARNFIITKESEERSREQNIAF